MHTGNFESRKSFYYHKFCLPYRQFLAIHYTQLPTSIIEPLLDWLLLTVPSWKNNLSPKDFFHYCPCVTVVYIWIQDPQIQKTPK